MSHAQQWSEEECPTLNNGVRKSVPPSAMELGRVSYPQQWSEEECPTLNSGVRKSVPPSAMGLGRVSHH